MFTDPFAKYIKTSPNIISMGFLSENSQDLVNSETKEEAIENFPDQIKDELKPVIEAYRNIQIDPKTLRFVKSDYDHYMKEVAANSMVRKLRDRYDALQAALHGDVDEAKYNIAKEQFDTFVKTVEPIAKLCAIDLFDLINKVIKFHNDKPHGPLM